MVFVLEVILGVLVARYARMSGRRGWDLTMGRFLVSILTLQILMVPAYFVFRSGVLVLTEVSGAVLGAVYYLGMAWFAYRCCREGVDFYTRPTANTDSSSVPV